MILKLTLCATIFFLNKIIFFVSNFLLISITSFAARNPYTKASDSKLALAEINSFVNNSKASMTFAYGYTLNMNAIIRYRSDNSAKSIAINNALNYPEINKSYNSTFIISLYDKSGSVLKSSQYLMADGSNICPTNCDVNILDTRNLKLANGVYFIDENTAKTNIQNYANMTNTSIPNHYDEVKSVYISSEVLDMYVKLNVSGLRVYHAIDSKSNNRCVYICGLDASGKMIESSFYKGDYTNICPSNCDIN